MAIDEIQFARLRDRFTSEYKKVDHIIADRRGLTSNLSKRAEYRDKISNAFNDICLYLLQIYHNSDKTDIKLECIARITPYLEKCKRAFVALRLNYNWPTNELTVIDLKSIRSLDEPLPKSILTTVEPQPSSSNQEQSEIASSTGHSDLFVDADETSGTRLDEIIHELSHIETESVDQAQTDDIDPTDQTVQQNVAAGLEQNADNTNETLNTVSNSNSGSQSNLSQNSGSHPDSINSSPAGSIENLNMVQTKQDFFKMASSVINYKFEGDPLKLDSFIEDAEFVELMTEADNKAICLQFLKTKIAGRAKECLPSDNSIKEWKDIKAALQKEIKPDSSLVIEGKFATLRISKGNYAKFSEEAENLAEAYRRSLIFEKFTREKASEMTIRKTKELCRHMSRSDVAKSVIDSTRYDNPAEVIATFITQNDVARKERKEQESFQKRPNNNFNKSRNSKFNKSGKFQKSDKKGNAKSNFHKNKGNNNQNKGRGNRNDHVIRIVADGSTPSTSADTSSHNSGEQVFRLAQS